MTQAPTDILALTGPELTAAAEERLASGAGVARDIYRAALRDGHFEPEACGLGREAAAAWRERFRLRLPVVVRRQDAPNAAGQLTEKVALELADGQRVECVRIPMRGHRSSLCISSQVGCRLACRFCETGQMGFVRDLTAAEIVAQVVVARAVLGWPVASIVFMGMGEPLDNLDNVITALRVMHDAHGLNYGRRRLTVCTAGLPDGIQRLGELGWHRLGLAVSLTSARQATRRELMPIARRVDLAALQRALAAYPQQGCFVLGINYCLLRGVNDADDDVEAIAKFVAPLGRTLVTVIPYNPGSEPIGPGVEDAEAERFVRRLQALGVAATQRPTKGREVMAACGQLGARAPRQQHGTPSP